MINLQWGTQKNGQIDTVLLVDVSGRGDYLEPTAAANWRRMVAACRAATGVTLSPAPGSSAYRPANIQTAFFTERYVRTSRNTGIWWDGSYWALVPGNSVAAIPGTSNHGWARAIDLTGYEYRPDVWAWLLAHAAEYGFSWATGKASGEQWHWESLTPPGSAVAGGAAVNLPTGDEFDMSTLDDLNRVVTAAITRATTLNLYRSPNSTVVAADVTKGYWREFTSRTDLNTFLALGIVDPDEPVQSVDLNTFNGIRNECKLAAKQLVAFQAEK